MTAHAVVLRAEFPGASAGVTGGMSTRSGGVSPPPFGFNTGASTSDDPVNVAANRRLLLEALGLEGPLALPGQVHGAAAAEALRPGMFESCDALMTAEQGLVLGVSVADCVPILLYDPARRAIAAVHAGWRGTAAGIVSLTVSRLAERYGSSPRDLRAWIGPSAGVCCYEVGEDVAARFAPPSVIRPPGGKARVDLRTANRRLLAEAGVPGSQIAVSGECTICSADLFHSYRRDGNRSGRMMAVIALTDA